ncbi:site-specific integrase [Microbacterium sp. ARD31]|uniref:tyrosine-type recombinase/integrase n=1 Tax=Microbacterium sp. ARD31 TaxID=2962576 RepID=UPI00288281CE|nr:site-specific integrase [Microbacterium sp. ARD31]MDT0181461.1 site-specific integrase [Microbacterium sp. ARD31]
MGFIGAYETAKGRRYRARYAKPDGTPTEKRGFVTKREAELFLSTVTVSKAMGNYIDPALSKMRIGDLATGWLESKQPPMLKPASFQPLVTSWNAHVAPVWGDRELSSIHKSEVQAWVSDMATRRSRSVVMRALGVLAGIIDVAVDDNRIAVNPARNLRTLPQRGLSKPRVYLSHEQVSTLAANSAHPTLVLVLAYTGLRWGEATALRVRHVSPARHRFNVEENAVLVKWQIHVGTPKSHERRSVPYPERLAPLIKAACADKGPDGLLFGNGVTHMKHESDDRSWFATSVRRARKEDPSIPRLTPHDLRHTAASLAISAGANVKAVQRMLGHASAAMTLDTYPDLFDDDLDGVAQRLNAAMSEIPASLERERKSPPLSRKERALIRQINT